MLVVRAWASLLGAAAFGACLLSAPGAAADEPEPLVRFDPDAVPPPAARTKLLLLGGTITALSYGGAVGSSYIWSTDAGASDLRIPVVGPWIKLGHTTLCNGEANCSDVMQVVGAVFVAIDGLGQVGGLALLAEGLFTSSGKKEALRSSFRTPSGAPLGGTFSSLLATRLGDVNFVPVPFVQAGSDAGVAVVGTF